MSSTLAKLYLPELFPTRIRLLGVSFGLIFGKIGELLSIPLCFAFYSWFTYGPFILFTIFGSVAFVAILLIPHETVGKSLD